MSPNASRLEIGFVISSRLLWASKIYSACSGVHVRRGNLATAAIGRPKADVAAKDDNILNRH